MSPARSLRILRIVGIVGLSALLPAASVNAEEGSCRNARKIGSEVRVSFDDQPSARPQLLFTGDDVGIFWHSGPDDAGTTRFARMTRQATPIAPPAVLAGVKEGPVVWDGAAYASAHPSSLPGFGVLALEFAKLGRDGARLGPPVLIPALYGQASSLVWTGDEYGLAFEALNEDAHVDTWLARVDSRGEEVLRVLGPTGDDHVAPQVAWDGLSYGVTWDVHGPDPYRFSFALLDPDDGVISVRLDGYPDDSHVRQLLWTGERYAQLFHVADGAAPPGSAWLAFFQGTETPAGIVRLPDGASHRLAWSGSAFGLTGEPADETGVWFQALDASGAPDGAPVALSPTGTGEASLAWIGDGYAAAWEDTRGGQSEIYMARVGCNCALADVPGNEMDEDCSGAPLCSPSQPWKGRGAFLSCVQRACARQIAAGTLTPGDCKDAVRQAWSARTPMSGRTATWIRRHHERIAPRR